LRDATGVPVLFWVRKKSFPVGVIIPSSAPRPYGGPVRGVEIDREGLANGLASARFRPLLRRNAERLRQRLRRAGSGRGENETMSRQAPSHFLRAALIALVSGGLLASCNGWNTPRPGAIQAQVQIRGQESGSVSYTGQMTRASGPTVPGAYRCFNNVGQGCFGSSISQEGGSALMVPLVSGGAETTVSSFIEFSALQTGTWSLDVTINDLTPKEFQICGIPVASGSTTTLTITSNSVETSATYQIGNEPPGKASICK
jgi:hypothetical protein